LTSSGSGVKQVFFCIRFDLLLRSERVSKVSGIEISRLVTT
jgi:hypothetical protein